MPVLTLSRLLVFSFSLAKALLMPAETLGEVRENSLNQELHSAESLRPPPPGSLPTCSSSKFLPTTPLPFSGGCRKPYSEQHGDPTHFVSLDTVFP